MLVHIVADDVLFKLTGFRTGTWAQFHKLLWSYIKTNNLQDGPGDTSFAKMFRLRTPISMTELLLRHNQDDEPFRMVIFSNR